MKYESSSVCSRHTEELFALYTLDFRRFRLAALTPV